jgi:hypothetical protein
MSLWLSGDGAAWARYEPSTGVLSEGHSRPDDEDIVLGETHHGWYSRLDGTLVVFYVWQGRVWVRIGDVVPAVASPASVYWLRQSDEMARLSLVDGAQVVATVVYFGGDEWGIPPELDFTMTSSEDFDFGEFIRRFLDNPTRMRMLAGAEFEFDSDAALAPEAKAVLDALPPMSRRDLKVELPHLPSEAT